MLDYPLDLLARVMDAPSVSGPPGTGDRRVLRVSTDSRSIQPGDLFFALKGENFDGHSYVPDALRRGAVAGVVHRGRAAEAGPGAAVIGVDDPLLALGQLGAWHRSRFNVRVVAVTGSVGKTTTKDFIAGVLAKRYRTLKSPASHNAEIGLPLTLLQLTAEHQVAVLEMAMRGPGQIRYLARLARPEVAAITRIGLSHIEFLGSQDAIAAAKAEVFDFLPEGGTAVLNAEDPYFDFLRSRVPSGANVLPYGLEPPRREGVSGTYLGPDTRVEGRGSFTPGARFKVRGPGLRGVETTTLPLLGRHNVQNALCAAAVGCALGVPWARILKGLEEAETSAMRMTAHRLRDFSVVLDDAYNASSPEAMAAALDVLREIGGMRKTAVLADMLELGDASEEAHREVGRLVAKVEPQTLVTVGERARRIAESAVEAGLPEDRVLACADKDEALARLQPRRRAGDVILVKGSRGMAMESLVKALLSEEFAR